VRFSVANAASRARRNTRSLAIFVRSARARCSYSGIERGPPDSRFDLKRSSAFSLEAMKISFAFKLRNAVPPDVEWFGPTARDDNCSEDAALFSVESGEAREI